MNDRFPFPAAVEAKDRWESAAYACLAGSVAAVLISIAAAQILLGLALALSVLRRPREFARCFQLPFVLPVAVLFVWTVLAALASADVRLGLGIVKKFFLFAVLFLTPMLLGKSGRVARAFGAIFTAAALSAAAGVVQSLADPNRDLLHRITGFGSHWMTYSGLLMLVFVSLAAYVVVCGIGRRGWTVALSALLCAVLVLSMTRNAWIGAVAGVAAVLVLHRPRAMLALAGLLALLLLLAPAAVRSRLQTGLDREDPNTRNRIELFGTALRLIRDNPWFGVGPKNVNVESLRYRGTPEFPDWMYQHMHNNFLQIAAERGVPGLLIWLWFMGRLAWDAWPALRRGPRRDGLAPETRNRGEAIFASTASLGCWVALQAAGLFEYNFGDSEVLVLFLFVASVPYAFPAAAPDPGRGRAATA